MEASYFVWLPREKRERFVLVSARGEDRRTPELENRVNDFIDARVAAGELDARGSFLLAIVGPTARVPVYSTSEATRGARIRFSDWVAGREGRAACEKAKAGGNAFAGEAPYSRLAPA